MRIITPPDFQSTLENHYLLLDTNVFIDSLLFPAQFERFFNSLKEWNITTVTLDVVLVEFQKGASERKKFDEKKELVDKIVDAYLPITQQVIGNLKTLVFLYKEDGKGISITDMFLGATLMQYPSRLYLLTKDISDFPTNIFTLNSYINLFHRKAIQNYGIYTFGKQKKRENETLAEEAPF